MYNHNQRRFTVFYIAIFKCLLILYYYLFIPRMFSLTFQKYSDFQINSEFNDFFLLFSYFKMTFSATTFHIYFLYLLCI